MSAAVQPPSPQPSPTRGEGVRTSAACAAIAHLGDEGSEPIPTNARRRISFWHYNLWLELSALALTAFAFSGGRLADYLRARGADAGLSEIMRGYEDNRSSVYYAVRAGTGHLLGRLDLSYVQDFLEQYSRFTGAPVLFPDRANMLDILKT